jgi:uncharacterized coiled-coil protein SlyX
MSEKVVGITPEEATQKLSELKQKVKEQETTIKMLVITVDELRSPLMNSNLHYLYERATAVLNHLEKEHRI